MSSSSPLKVHTYGCSPVVCARNLCSYLIIFSLSTYGICVKIYIPSKIRRQTRDLHAQIIWESEGSYLQCEVILPVLQLYIQAEIFRSTQLRLI